MTPKQSSESRGLSLRWSRLSLRARGLLVLSLPILVLFAVMYAIYWMQVVSNNSEATLLSAYDMRLELVQLPPYLRDIDSALTSYAASHEDRYLSSYESARAATEPYLRQLGRRASEDAPSAEAIQAVQGAHQEVALAADEIRVGEAGSRPRSLRRAKSAIAQMQAGITRLNQIQEARLFDARTTGEQARQRTFRIVMIVGVLGPVFFLFGHLVVTERLAKRLRDVSENARRLAHDLPLDPFPSGSDEIAGLARQIEDAAFLLRERERELRDSERRYRDLFDLAPIPYEETDREGVIRRFNQAVCTLLRCQPDRILGRRAWDFVAPDEQETFRAAMMDRLASGSESGPYECEYFLEDGSRINIEIRETLMRDNSGAVTGVCRSLMDVTERNIAAMAARKVEQYALELRNKNEQLGRALEAARSATEAKSRFLAGISHELRTPLNAIIGFSELMHDARVGPVSDEHREFLSDILTSARHLLRLINDILDLSKIEAGKMEFRPERRFVHSLVYEVCDVVRPLAEKKNMEIGTDVPQDVVVILDTSRFKQVLYNYLSNAVKFTPAGGKVSVRITVEEGARFRLEVEDTGIGIDPAELPLLFKEFQQLPNSRKADQGTGLGLALTRTIVEAQGGKVAARSEPGRGSVFSAVLPLDTRGSVNVPH